MSDENARSTYRVCGRIIGTATGLDISDDGFQIYDFEPNPNVDLPPAGCLGVDFETGLFISYNDAGYEVYRRDIVSVLRMVPRSDDKDIK